MANPGLDGIMYIIRNARSKTNAPELNEDQLREYISRELDNVEKGRTKTKENDAQIAKQIGDIMNRNPDVRRKLKEVLPVTNKARKDRLEKLRNDAARTGIDKLKNDFRGIKKRAAQRELREIANAKNKLFSETDLRSDIANNSISTGRGRNFLTDTVNDYALGTYDERHPKNVAFQENDKGFDIEHHTSDGVLKGAFYKASPAIDTGKVVIFFSGSAGSAEQYSPLVISDYVQSGVSVVTMNYRGFGDSITTDKDGNKIDTPLCENSLYKDGQTMLNYVLNEMKIKPENVILHGYSLGGAIASKVAADYAQNQQKNAINKGKTVKKLGGVVLHSPMPTLREASYDVVKPGLEEIPVIGPVLSVVGGAIVGQGAHDFGGAYNTRSHMRRLHQFDPDIPVHYVSGTFGAEDDMDINKTQIHNDPKAQFTHHSSHIGEGGHEDRNLDLQNPGLREMLTTTRTDFKPSKPAPEIPKGGLVK